MATKRELQTLLSQWAKIEPERCRRTDKTSFEVKYQKQWLPASTQPAHHGAIVAAVLEGCEQRNLFCEIDYTPRIEDQPPTIAVGCIPRMFRFEEGDRVITSLPALLLIEYLERLRSSETTE